MSPQSFPIPKFKLRTQGLFQAREPKPAAQAPAFPSGHFTEFYCVNGGSNLNAGSDTSTSAKYTSTNGNWNSTTGVFTPTDGTNPVSAGARAGDWASVYIDGATLAVCSLLITSVVDAVNGAITTNGAIGTMGTAPTTSATARSIKIGGAWKGPNGSQLWPFSQNLLSAKDTDGNLPRINLKNDQTYNITVALTFTGQNISVQGYTVTPNDGGKAIIDAGGGNFTIVQIASGSITVSDVIIQNNASSSTNHGLSTSSGNGVFYRVVVNTVQGIGFSFGNSSNTAIECEAYNCNKANLAGQGGFVLSSQCIAVSCIAHHNAGSNSDGFTTVANSALVTFIDCISAFNGRCGFAAAATIAFNLLLQCDAYANAYDGFRNANTTANAFWFIRNCNFVKNGGLAINSTATTGRFAGFVDNCGFGTGLMANTQGNFNNIGALQVANSVIFASGVTPWLDPNNLKFDLVLPQALSAGRGNFTITASGYGPTTGYPDIGAAPAQSFIFTWQGTDEILPQGYISHSYLAEWTLLVASTVTLTSGSLPPGLSIVQLDNTHFEITGTPTTLGAYDFTLRQTIGTTTGDATFHITVLADPDEGSAYVGGL